MSRLFLGIDPGLDGALACIGPGEMVTLSDTPTLVIAGRGRDRRVYDLPRMRESLLACGDLREASVAIERVHAMPKQGVRSAFSFGYGLGLWEGLLVGLGVSYEYVTPQRWQRGLLDGQGKGKDAARGAAARLFPHAAEWLQRKRDHGRADALLLAEWVRRQRR